MRRNKNLPIRQKNSDLDLIVFSIQGYNFAVESSAVKEYLTNTKIIPLPQSEKRHLIGLLNLRGEYYSVIDLILHLDLIENTKNRTNGNENAQKILVLNPPSQQKSSRVAFLIEDLALLFRTPQTKIWTSVPGVMYPTEFQARKKGSTNKGLQQLQNPIEKILNGLIYDKKLGLIFYLNDLALHELVDQTKVEKINPVALLEKTSKTKRKKGSVNLWEPASILESFKSDHDNEYLIGRVNDLIFLFPYDNVQVLGLREEFITLSKNDAASLSLPTVSGVENYILYDDYLHPLVSFEKVFPSLFHPQNIDGSESVVEDAASSKHSQSKMLFIAKDDSNRIRLAISLDNFIEIDRPRKTLSLTHPFVYPHLKEYYPLIEKLAILHRNYLHLQDQAALIVNMNHVLEQISNKFMESTENFAWEALQVPLEQLPTLTKRIITNQNILYLQNLQLAGSTESYVTFYYTASTKLAMMTTFTKDAHPITEFDLEQLNSKMPKDSVITTRNVKDGETYVLLNPYTKEILSTLGQAGNATSKQVHLTDENWLESFQDDLFVITFDVDKNKKDDKRERLSMLCFKPEPLVTMGMEKILPPKIKEFPPEIANLPVNGELKNLFKQHEQKRTFILDVEKFITTTLEHAGGAQ